MTTFPIGQNKKATTPAGFRFFFFLVRSPPSHLHLPRSRPSSSSPFNLHIVPPSSFPFPANNTEPLPFDFLLPHSSRQQTHNPLSIVAPYTVPSPSQQHKTSASQPPLSASHRSPSPGRPSFLITESSPTAAPFFLGPNTAATPAFFFISFNRTTISLLQQARLQGQQPIPSIINLGDATLTFPSGVPFTASSTEDQPILA